MSAERHLKSVSFTGYLLKNIGSLRFIPPVILNLIVPVLIVLSYFNSTDFESNFLMITQYFFPLFSVWFALFSLRELLEAEGREIFFSARNTDVLFETGKLFLILLSDILILTAVCTIMDFDFAMEFVRIISVCVFYFSLVYFLSMCTKSVSITLLAVVIYTLINAVFRSHIVRFPIYMSTNVLSSKEALTLCLPFIVLSAVLIMLGRIIEKHADFSE